jgi:hypothetical protein
MHLSALHLAITVVLIQQLIGQTNGASKFKTKIEKLVKYLAGYLETNSETEPNHRHTNPTRYVAVNHNDNCDTIDKINDYFFDVFGSNNGSITEIDDVIRYSMINGGNQEFKNKQKTFRCKRDNVSWSVFEKSKLSLLKNIGGCTKQNTFLSNKSNSLHFIRVH